MDVRGLLEQVLIVIVLYRQRLEDCKAFDSVRPLMEKYPGLVSLFVYDNSEERANATNENAYYVHDPKNSGVSRAYNEAFRYAQKNGFRFMLLMDQDSFFHDRIFDSYSHAVACHPALQVFAPRAKDNSKMYSPFRFVRGRGVAVSSRKAGIYSPADLTFINSGLLVTLDAFEKCGGYDERFPLDFSDIAFCDRLCANGFSVCLIDDLILHAHSSTQSTDKDRFENYLRALALYKQISKQNISYWWGGFLRAAKLSVQLRDRWFLERFFHLRV